MQLHLRFFWSHAATHEDTHWGKAFQVQPLQQSLQTKTRSHKTFPTSHDLRLDQYNLQICLKTSWSQISSVNVNVNATIQPIPFLCHHHSSTKQPEKRHKKIHSGWIRTLEVKASMSLMSKPLRHGHKQQFWSFEMTKLHFRVKYILRRKVGIWLICLK